MKPSASHQHTLSFRLCVGSAGLVRKPQVAHDLRQCNVLASSRGLVRSRQAQILATPTRVVNIRADGSVKAVAVDQPPTSTSSGGKEKVRIGINGEFCSVLPGKGALQGCAACNALTAIKVKLADLSSMSGNAIRLPAQLLALVKRSSGASAVQHTCAVLQDACMCCLHACLTAIKVNLPSVLQVSEESAD